MTEVDNLAGLVADIVAALEQAQDCIKGETPEDMSHDDADADTISKIRAVLFDPRLSALASLSARNQELVKERDQWDRRTAYDELKAREYENRSTQQAQIDALTIRAEAAEADNARLVEVEKAARAYFMGYVQDEADDEECCIDGDQHRLAGNLRDALHDAALSPTDAVGEEDPLSAEERDTLQSLLNAMGFGRSFDALKKLMSALPASAPQNGERGT